MKGKVWKRIRGSENKNWGKKTSFSNVISPLVTGLVSIALLEIYRNHLGIIYRGGGGYYWRYLVII